jgi:uncharacterized SAM-binding protein YcdF (DUF218 family)
MFFIFSKLLLPLILPFTWILVWLIAAAVVKKPKAKKKLLLISLLLTLIFSNPFLLNKFADLWDIKRVPLTSKQPYSCVIVLCGFTTIGPDGVAYFNGASDRFIQGLKLLEMHKVSHILISGGNGNLSPGSFKESDWSKTQLKLFNVPDSCILIEDKSRNTIENAAFSKTVLQKNNLKPPYILVTSAFHMRRALGIFKKAKIEVIPYPCSYLAGGDKFTFDQLIPDVYNLDTWNMYTKEVVGTTVNVFRK